MEELLESQKIGCPKQTEMECFKEQMQEMQKRISCLVQSEEYVRSRLQKVANEAENMKQSCLSNKKWNASYPTRGKENAVDAEYAKEIISKLLGEMNKLRAYWMQEMQLRHCCQNEIFEYKHLIAGLDASSCRNSEELEYCREQATRYKQTLISTTKWCIQTMNDTAVKIQNMVMGHDKLENFGATIDRIRTKLKSFYEEHKANKIYDNTLQRDLFDSNQQLTNKLEAIQNDIQLLKSAIERPNENTQILQKHEELKKKFQEMKEEIQEQVKKTTEVDKITCMKQKNFQLLADLKIIAVDLQNIGNKIATERRILDKTTMESTDSSPNRKRQFQFSKCTDIESIQPHCHPLSIDKLCKATIVSISPQTDEKFLSTNSEANESQNSGNTSTWKVFNIRNNRRVGARRRSFQVSQDSIQTFHDETVSESPILMNTVPSTRSSQPSNKAKRSSKRQVSKRKPKKKQLVPIGDKDKIEAVPKEGTCNNSQEEQVEKQDNDNLCPMIQMGDSRETKQDANVNPTCSGHGKFQDAKRNMKSKNSQHISTNEQQSLKIVEKAPDSRQRAVGNQQIARSSKCFGKKRKSNIIDEYELTAETCSQTLPLSFFQNLQI